VSRAELFEVPVIAGCETEVEGNRRKNKSRIYLFTILPEQASLLKKFFGQVSPGF
jgi:hypothetical protein